MTPPSPPERGRTLFFVAPRVVEIRDCEIPAPAEGEVLVESELSAISSGTELLLYRGEIPEGTALDETLPSLAVPVRYPVAYGYALVGRVRGEGRRVFAFEPHRSRFLARADSLHPIPEELASEAAVLLPTLETAIGLVQDARPLLGERVLVVGQGVVGLVTTALLSRFPLSRLVAVDRWETRRALSCSLGAHRACAPEELEESDFDLTFEISGSPEALDLCLRATGAEGRIVVGSWYGSKRASVDLGTHFHRGRITIASSQVSRLAPRLLSRWTKARRLAVAVELAKEIPWESLVSHRFDLERAPEAYRLLDEHPEACIQVLLSYT